MNNSGNLSTADLVKLQRHILGIQNLTTAYKIQKAGAFGGSINSISTADLLKMQRLILGIHDVQDPLTQAQFIKLADANGDGNLNNLDKSSTYIPPGSSSLFNLDYSDRTNFISEIQESIGMIDGDGDTYTSQDWKTWTNNF